MKIFTTKGLNRIYSSTIENETISALDLIERQGSAIACEIISRWIPKKRFILFAGPGNNGSIALAVARLLLEQGYHVEVVLFNIPSMPIGNECRINRDRLKEIENVDFTEVTTRYEPPYITHDDIVIDGLFGADLSAPLKGGFTTLVQQINSSHAYVISIDIPSGLLADWNFNNDRRNIIRASLTLCFQFKFLSFFFAENAQFIGTCKTLDIELCSDCISSTPTNFYMVEDRDLRRWLKKRDLFSNKYDYGALLLVAGSYGMMGAAVLAARAALRSGVGLVTVHSPSCGFPIIQSAVPEALFEYDKGQVSVSEITPKHKFSAVALGPGMGTEDITVNAVDAFFKSQKKPLVIDADALNCIALRPALLDSLPPLSVLTPHAAEFDRIFGEQFSTEDRLRKALEASKRYSVIIVLKGHHTFVVRPDGNVYINSTGGAGLATPGSGDVLTGLIGGFMAQGYSTEMSAAIAVFVHGAAGDKAETAQGAYSVTAGDVIEQIGHALKEIMTRKD